MNKYTLELKRGKMTCYEKFKGNKIDLLLYKLKMRKWKVSILK